MDAQFVELRGRNWQVRGWQWMVKYTVYRRDRSEQSRVTHMQHRLPSSLPKSLCPFCFLLLLDFGRTFQGFETLSLQLLKIIKIKHSVD